MLWRFSKPVFVAILFAWPIAWSGARSYLDSFAYRIELGPVLFLGSAIAAILIAWGTVGGHAVKVALTNPTQALGR
jgi:putative ABC transport system permease protein